MFYFTFNEYKIYENFTFLNKLQENGWMDEWIDSVNYMIILTK